jgi:hypothetical protein
MGLLVVDTENSGIFPIPDTLGSKCHYLKQESRENHKLFHFQRVFTSSVIK